jgi:hypothetical protein
VVDFVRSGIGRGCEVTDKRPPTQGELVWEAVEVVCTYETRIYVGGRSAGRAVGVAAVVEPRRKGRKRAGASKAT